MDGSVVFNFKDPERMCDLCCLLHNIKEKTMWSEIFLKPDFVKDSMIKTMNEWMPHAEFVTHEGDVCGLHQFN